LQIFQYFPSGDSAIIIKAGDDISVEINRTVRSLLARIEQEKIVGIVDFIPSYNELMVCYNPAIIGFRRLVEIVKSLDSDLDSVELPASSTILVPVVYGGDFGPDLQDVAVYNNLSAEDVVKIHSSATYLVYMLGFTPGFCYLGGMDERIAMPRKECPRLKIPEGAVGIAGSQTGIYPIESPGGWQLIGQTPLKLFDINRNTNLQQHEFLFHIGDTLRFVPINECEYNLIKTEIAVGTYNYKTQ